jgi:phthiocerol/phenolphthiocerol synthesis type-I polyketide synthase E
MTSVSEDISVSEDVSGEDTGMHIAVIGMACRFPGAGDPGAFWRNLVGGLDTVTRLTARPLPGRAADDQGAQYVPARGLLKDPEWFDAGYFGYTPREARLISPQHRVFLECGVEALEHAGYDPERYSGAIGVYAGGTQTAYAQILESQRATLKSVTDWEILLGSGTDFLVSRLAYKLGLRGPSVTVQAACATSLVAVHIAIQALLSGDCSVALAGGIAVHVPAKDSRYAKGGILSADGTCRTFDAAASGTVGSDGAGIVVLKRLADALADADHIHAVIRGSAVNNDGSDRVGFTAPSIDGQAAVIREAQLVAGVDAGTVTYVEAHGTATPLGDPIEVAALTKAFRLDTDRTGFCRIGSVKSNIGHADTAAGAAGLIKTVMAVEHGLIPPSLHFTQPNPEIDFDASPFLVTTELAEWNPQAAPRRAGVSAFGIGGTNAHLVLEEPPEPAPPAASRPWQLLALSARTPAALDAATAALAGHLRDHQELPLADVAWTLQVGRREHAYRRFAIASGTADAAAALTDPDRLVTIEGSPPGRAVAFRFPGAVVDGAGDDGGEAGEPAQADPDFPGWAESDPDFRRWADECCDSAPTLVAGARSALLLDALGRLWLSGMSVPWAAVHGGARRARVPLPTYPFERQRYLVEAPGVPDGTAEPAQQADLDGGDADVAPGIGTLAAVTRLFGHFLELPEIGADDSFFDLGGDSLLVADLLAEVFTEFAVDFDMQSVYDAPTAAAFAALIDEQAADRKVPLPAS